MKHVRERLGQHFLKDQKALARIVASLAVSENDTIIEIGPGHGELTEYILKAGPKKVIAIEKDKDLVSSIQYLVSSKDNLEIINGDALKILPTVSKTYHLSPLTYKLVGNIPYYITGRLLRIIGELEDKPSVVVLTIQKEVAERLSAKPPRMNLLAASVQFWGIPEIIRTISRHAFRPQPKVESAIIRVVLREKALIAPDGTMGINQRSLEDSDRYYKFIKILSKQPRKTVANNLKDGSDYTRQEVEEFLKSHNIEPTLRPQNLDIDTINILSQSF